MTSYRAKFHDRKTFSRRADEHAHYWMDQEPRRRLFWSHVQLSGGQLGGEVATPTLFRIPHLRGVGRLLLKPRQRKGPALALIWP
jgi:hypothetical protein